MNSSEKRWKPDVDRAWQVFYARAEGEMLIPVGANRRRLNPYYLMWSAAAVLIIFIGITALYLIQPSWSLSKIELITLQNERDNEVFVATLPDGSLVFLSPGGTLTYPSTFAYSQRLLSFDGEAFFEVSEDQNRPFIVETEFITVHVVGTSFRIKTNTNTSFELAVRSGVVKAALKSEEREVFVEEGEQVQLVNNWLQKSFIEDQNVLNRGVNKLYFKEESLGQIIRVVNECIYGRKSLVLRDESLSSKVITVTLHTQSRERIAEILCNALDLEQTFEGRVIYLGRR